MANDIASLGLRVDSAEVEKGAENLEKLAQAGAKAEAEVKDIGTASNQTGAQIRVANQELDKAKRTLDQTGISAKQTAAALRGVPAQFTDIVVSLQGGQNPLTVLLQQGGQLKDMFGGVGPAARALGGYVAGLVNPFTLTAAAIAGVTIAYEAGASESRKYKDALILTGDASGATSDQLADTARKIDALTGTQRQAASALAEIASTGRFTATQIDAIGIAAVSMQNATGAAIDDTVADFSKLAKEPSKAITELDEKYHFLTASIYEQISSLERQGDEVGAADLAINTYAATLRDRSKESVENIGYLEKAWRAVKNATLEAADAAAGIGREDTPEQQLQNAYERLNQLTANGRNAAVEDPFRYDSVLKDIQTLQGKIAETTSDALFKSIDSSIQQEGVKAAREINAISSSSLNNEQKRDKLTKDYLENIKKLRQANPNSALLDQAKIDRDLKNIRDNFKDPAAPKTKAYQDDAATRMLQTLGQQEASLRAQLDTAQKLTDSQKELAKFEQLIADLKDKKTLTADQKSLQANELQIRAQLEKNVALEDERKKREEILQVQSLTASLEASRQSERERYSDSLEGFTLGSEAKQRLQERQRIQREYERQVQQAGRDRTNGKISDETYQAETEALKRNLDERLRDFEDYYRNVDDLQGDWQNGASQAFNDYLESARDVSSQTRDLFSNAFSNMEDGIVDFVKTGKLSFKDFANSLIEDLIRIQVRQAAAGLLSSAFSGGSSLFGGSGTMTGFSEGSSYSFGGGRAVGGSVDPDKFYEVNEKGPELFSQGGRTYLMSGSQGGYVTPIADTSRMSSQSSGSSNSSGGVAVHQTFHVAGDVSQETLNRMAEMSRQAAEQGAQSGYRMVMQDVHRNGPIRQRLSR